MSEESRISNRVDYETKVHLEFEKFSGFITEYSTNISKGGMFVKSDEPLPLGSVLSFEFRLKDDFHLIQGLGEVVWVRSIHASEEKPSGMGIKFREISEQSLELIESMTQNLIKSGQQPFDLSNPPEDAEFDPKKENVFEDISDISFAQINESPSSNVSNPSDLGSLLDSIEVEEDPSHVAIQASSNTSKDGEAVRADLQSLFDLSEDRKDETTDTQQDSLSNFGSFDLDMGSAGDEENMSEPASAVSPDETFHLNDSFEDSQTQGSSTKSGRKKVLYALLGATFVSAFAVILGVLGMQPFAKYTSFLPFVSSSGPATEIAQVEQRTNTFSEKKDSQTTETDQSEPEEKLLGSEISEDSTKAASDKEEPKTIEEEAPELNLKRDSENEPAAIDLTEKSKTVKAEENSTQEAASSIPKKTAADIDTPISSNEPAFPPVKSIETFSWKKDGKKLIVTLKGDGKFQTHEIKQVHLRAGKPREVLIISGVTQAGNNQRHSINSNGILRARSGLHMEKKPSEVHYVFDLTDPDMKITELRAIGKNLHIEFSK